MLETHKYSFESLLGLGGAAGPNVILPGKTVVARKQGAFHNTFLRHDF